MSKAAKSYVRVESHGNVTIREERLPSGKTRIRSWAETKKLPKEMWRKTHPDWATARTFATQANNLIDQSRKIDDEHGSDARFAVKNALKQISQANASRTSPLEPQAVVAIGIEFSTTLEEINRQRESVGMEALKTDVAFQRWKNAELRAAQEKFKETFDSVIDRCVKFKSSKHGGRGNRELDKKTKREWKEILQDTVKPWIGHLKIGTPRKELQRIIVNQLNLSTVSRGKTKGQSISQRRKINVAKKCSQFGKWLVSEELLPTNPFSELPQQFADDEFRLPDTLTADEVKRLFKEAMKPNNKAVIPYMALLFFSSVRPGELADWEDIKRRLRWSQFADWEHDSKVTGGKLFKIETHETVNGTKVRRSKISYERYADLSPNGVKWIEWALGELPTKGKLYASREIFDRVKEEAGVEWKQDIARHTFCSFARNNPEFDAADSDSYWGNASGHSTQVFRKHYSAPKTPTETKAFFAITPEAILEDNPEAK